MSGAGDKTDLQSGRGSISKIVDTMPDLQQMDDVQRRSVTLLHVRQRMVITHLYRKCHPGGGSIYIVHASGKFAERAIEWSVKENNQPGV